MITDHCTICYVQSISNRTIDEMVDWTINWTVNQTINRMINRLIEQMIDRLNRMNRSFDQSNEWIKWLIEWIDQMIDRMNEWSIDWMNEQLINWLIWSINWSIANAIGVALVCVSCSAWKACEQAAKTRCSFHACSKHCNGVYKAQRWCPGQGCSGVTSERWWHCGVKALSSSAI